MIRNEGGGTISYTGLRSVANAEARLDCIRKLAAVCSTHCAIKHYLSQRMNKAPCQLRRGEFDIPREATQTGTMTLEWTCPPGSGGNGRGCQVSEVWLVRK